MSYYLVMDNELLEPGTRVRGKVSGRNLDGQVWEYERQHATYGMFPVRFDDGVWRMRTTADVTPLGKEIR